MYFICAHIKKPLESILELSNFRKMATICDPYMVMNSAAKGKSLAWIPLLSKP